MACKLFDGFVFLDDYWSYGCTFRGGGLADELYAVSYRYESTETTFTEKIVRQNYFKY